MIDHPHRWLFSMASVGLAAGLAEGAVLVLVVRVTLELTSSESSAWTIPLTSTEVSTEGLLWIAAGLAVLTMLLHVVTAHLSAQAASSVLVDARRSALQAFSRATWDRQTREREGALQETVMTLAGQSSQLANSLAAGLASLLSLLALLTIAAVVDPAAMVIATGFGVLLAVALRPLSQLTRRRASAYVAVNGAFAEDVSQMTSLVQELRVFGVQELATENLLVSSRATARIYEQVKFIQRLGWSLYRDVAILLLVGALIVLYVMDQVSLLGTGTAVILVVRAMISAQAVHRGAQSIHELGPNLVAMEERIASLGSAADISGDRPLDFVGAVDLVDVSYRYGNGVCALDNLTFQIEPGEVLGIVGPSGGGKSTLVQILLRLRLPSSGVVLVNGEPYEHYREREWSNLVTLVPQEPHLMEASVADNIRFLRDDIDDDAVRRSAEAAHIAAEILDLPDGFDTRLGPRGIGLSGGQKQRLALARALAGRPELIVLDEPTSALDPLSEQLFLDTIRELKGSVTLIIVAHRATTLTECDRLLVLRGGRVTHLATPDEVTVDIAGPT